MYNAAVVARSVLRSARTGTTRISASAKHKAPPSPFRMNRLPTQNPPSLRFARSPVEMSFLMESMLPYHSATASALLTSMLAVAPRTYGWVLQGYAPSIAMMMYDDWQDVRAKLWMIAPMSECGWS